MKPWIAHFACGAALAGLAVIAFAQGGEGGKALAVAAPAAPIESVDILRQNQAQRSKDQPGNLAPTYRIVKEGRPNYSSLPAREAGVLIQPKAQFPGQARAVTAGQAWRSYRNGTLTQIGGGLLIAAALGVALVYFTCGPIKLKQGLSGRMIERFTALERIVHWTVALSFVALALSGMTILFGKYVLLPLFGHTLFGWLAFLCKGVHNFVGPVFTLSIVVFFALFVKDNLPAWSDLKWLLRLGGLLGGGHAHSGRFNAGEKFWFWGGMVALGLVVSGSGFVLDMLLPNVDYTRANLQIADVVHVVGALLIAAMACGHIYLGTIGMQGAYAAMRTGYVDDAWAEAHHDLWYDDIQNGKVPRVRSREGAERIGAPAQA